MRTRIPIIYSFLRYIFKPAVGKDNLRYTRNQPYGEYVVCVEIQHLMPDSPSIPIYLCVTPSGIQVKELAGYLHVDWHT